MEKLRWIYVLLFLNTICGSDNNNSTVNYYVNLIKEETTRASTYPLPQDASEYEPNSNKTSYYGTFDYIIIGAGSAGSVIANRLSEIKHNQILLLEAGGHESNFSEIPAMVFYLQNLEYNWNYNTIPQTKAYKEAANTTQGSTRGKGLGGSTIVNFGLYVRGNKNDYDNWAIEGNPGWSYKDVLPYFKKSEDSHINGDEGYHGTGGNLNVEYHKPDSPQFDAFVEANLELGRKVVDYNGKEQIGVSKCQLNTIYGRKDSVGKAFLTPAANRKNLKILPHSFAIKILITPLTKKAYGVIFSHKGQLFKAITRKEIILSAGTIASPQLLMLSGIGPKSHLQNLGIPVIQSLPVGNNYQDHPTFFSLTFQTNYSEPLKSLEKNVEDYLNDFGLLTISGNSQGLAFLQTNMSKISGYPDIEIMINPSNNLNNLVCTGEESCSNNTPSNTFTLSISQLRPKSRGTIRLKSKNPYDYPLIDPNYFSDSNGEDIETLYQGIQLALEIANSNAFKKFNTSLILNPIPECKQHEYLSKDFWYCMLREFILPMVHCVGSCKMGPDSKKGAVVDHELKVHGIKYLRVADASIMPNIIAGHTSAPTIMIGEKVSDMIKNGK